MAVSKSGSLHADRQDQVATSFLLILAIGFLACLFISIPPIKTTWLAGTYNDTDDAMRMIQIRDWMGGQGWYDLRALRLDPPAGVLMHWSRVVDIPVAGLIRLFDLFADQQTAERLARIVFPLVMQACLLLATGLCGRLLAGAFGGTIAIFLTIGSGMSLWQFIPGRIDHHGPQIVLLALMTWACLCALDPKRPHMAAAAGLFAALSLSIAIENLPFIIVLMAIFPLAYAVLGAPMRAALVWMGAGFAASLTLCYALFQSPSLWLVSACDALSAVHIRAALAGGAAMILLAAFDRWRNPGLRGRILATGLAGLLAATPLFLDRQCYLDPFSGLDPLVRDLWLAGVREARSIPQMLREHPEGWGVWVMPWALGALAMAAAVAMEQGLSRIRYMALLAITLAGCATAFYMVRSVSSVSPLALLGGVWVVTQLRQACGRRELIAALAVVAALAPFTAAVWAAEMPIAERADEKKQDGVVAKCNEAAAFAPLRALPTGRFMTPPDLGPFLLLNTNHSVIAGPYHRNNHGNRLMFDAFLAAPEAAREMLRAAGVNYVALCDAPNTVGELIQKAPDGLAAAIAEDKPLDWLRPIKADTPLRVYEVVAGP